jgi:hypothetical protein
LWHDAARGEGAVVGFGDVVTGRDGGGNGCWADAADEKARDPATLAIATRIPNEGVSINITGSE